MPICDSCGEETDHVTKCKTCGDKFCADCGDVQKQLCLYCIDDENADDDNSWDADNR